MKTIYVEVFHRNTVDEDSVEIVAASENFNIAHAEMLMIAEKLYKRYIVLEDNETYKKFSDLYEEFLIEVSKKRARFRMINIKNDIYEITDKPENICL